MVTSAPMTDEETTGEIWCTVTTARTPGRETTTGHTTINGCLAKIRSTSARVALPRSVPQVRLQHGGDQVVDEHCKVLEDPVQCTGAGCAECAFVVDTGRSSVDVAATVP